MDKTELYMIKMDILSIATELNRIDPEVIFSDPNKTSQVVHKTVRNLLNIAYERMKDIEP